MTPPSPNPNNLRPPPGCRPYQPYNKNRVCGHTFVNETALPAGQKLLACGKCKEVFYVDRERQKEHWVKAHKYVCCSIAEDDPRVRQGFESIDQCFQVFENVIDGWINHRELPKGRIFLHALKEIKDYSTDLKLKHGDTGPLVQQYCLAMNRVNASFEKLYHNAGSDHDNTAFTSLLWSSPGFGNYFLSKEIFLSPAMKWDKEKGLPPPGKIPFAQGPDGLTRTIITPERRLFQMDGQYCATISLIFMWSCLSCRRWGALVSGIMRNMFDRWTCPYSRASFPHTAAFIFEGEQVYRAVMMGVFVASFARPSSPWSSPIRQSQSMREGEFLPGLTLKALLSVTMEDEVFFMLPKDNVDDVYSLLFDAVSQLDGDPELRKYLSAQDRWDLLKTWVTWNPPNPKMVVANRSCLGQLYLDLIVGDRAETAFQLYFLAKAEFSLNDPEDCDQEAHGQQRLLGALIETRRSLALRTSKPLVASYVEIIQVKYEQVMQRSGMDPLPFPEDIEDLIGEFAAEETIP